MKCKDKFTFNLRSKGLKKLIDGSIPIIFLEKKHKEDRGNKTPAQVFYCEICEIFKNIIF